MATDIILRSVKASALTHAEMDQNWESICQTVDVVTVSATIAVTDQNKILECSISSGTMTLPTVSAASGTDTDSFRVTVKNINASSLIVDGNGAETIEGVANVVLLENEAATFALGGDAGEWNITAFYGPNLVGVTASKAELNIMDGVTSTTAELNILDGVTSTAAELNILDGVTSTAAELNILDGVTSTTAELNILDGVTSTASELNILDGVTSTTSELNILDGVTATTTELNYTDVTTAGTAQASKAVILDASKGIASLTSLTSATINASTSLEIGGVAVTSTAAEINILDGALLDVTELNYVNGVTSAIQTQLAARQPLDADLTAIAALANTNSNFIVGNGSAWVAETGATARSSLGVDPIGTDNSTNVTLAGTPNYITISGQTITRGLVDMAADITGVLPAGNLGTNAVTTVKINALAVTEAKIAALAVTVGKLAANAVTRSKISTATVSLGGALAGTVQISLTAYSFFPMIHTAQNNKKVSNYDQLASTWMCGNSTDGASADSPSFSLSDYFNTANNTYDVDYRYIQA